MEHLGAHLLQTEIPTELIFNSFSPTCEGDEQSPQCTMPIPSSCLCCNSMCFFLPTYWYDLYPTDECHTYRIERDLLVTSLDTVNQMNFKF